MGYSLAEKLYANKPYRKIVEVLALKIEFQRLSAADEEEIARSISVDSLLALIQARRIPTLARSIKSIDGIEWKEFDEVKQHLRSNPGSSLAQAIEVELKSPEKYPDEVVSALHGAYTDFASEYRQVLEGLKKTSAPLNPVTAG